MTTRSRRSVPWVRVAAFGLAALVAGCGPDGSRCPGDAMTAQSTLSADNVGNGSFVPVMDGSRVRLHFGFQGGQHVFIRVEARGIRTDGVQLEIEVTDRATGESVARVVDESARFEPSIAPGWTMTGSRLVALRSSQIRSAHIRATVRDSAGGCTEAAADVAITTEGPDASAGDAASDATTD